MIQFKNKKYELLFSNNLALFWALFFADDLFFYNFKKICGMEYRILSIIKNGWQNKYGLISDLEKLKLHFENKIKNPLYIKNLLKLYDLKSADLKKELQQMEENDYSKINKNKIYKDLKIIKKKSSILDAMSNMLYLFSVLNGPNFEKNLNLYKIKNKQAFNKNLIYYTQPIKESDFAKIQIKKFDQKIKLNKYDKNFSLLLRIGAFVKDDVSTLLTKRQKIINQIFNALSKELKIKSSNLNYLQLKELLNINEFEIPDLIRSRKKLTVIFYSNSIMQINDGERANLFLKKYKFSEIKGFKSQNLTGQIANPGKVVGRAMVVHNSKEANTKIKKGDILVAPYTAVEYFPAMKKSMAIITETGGITSHAAIVSRELKIPCIIGVKNVTKILKTGDKISVDADSGEIKIIN